MKFFIAAILATISIQSFAAMVEYTGNNNGEACTVKLDFNKGYAEMGDIGILYKKKTSKGNSIILEGGADFTDARITLNLVLDETKEVMYDLQSAKLETRNPIKFFYTTKLKCTDLVRTK